jgi:thiol-disulfide isomerase/thioredoxin
MKYSILVLFFLSVSLISCRTNKPVAQSTPASTVQAAPVTSGQSFNYHDQTTFLLGYFNPSMLRREPHSTWFMKGYDDYMPGSQALNNLMGISQDDITIKIVMGTWCPDSRREVPRFMKIIDLWHFPEDKITFVGVNEDKIAPVGDFDKLNIERVPTFIFYKNNVETGRIIEVPRTSLEQDMVNILTGMNK